VNTTLTHVDIRSSSITATGARALVEALQINTTLSTLEYDIVIFGAEGARIKEALGSNSTRARNWNRRKEFLLFLYYEEFNLLESSGDEYTIQHIESPMTDVFFNRDLDRYICLFL
jgi:hypothetical protein